ncbi:PREDICTED: ninja-family protein AFP3-like [Lupinus angustifolius]|uniref:ninja-family protein AFP3-like n=1 Tax=Lupinus angustifolius TaxID=3871 RepID=UPI00092EB3D6|nr:PREDICTED: ninja-family protein AFP3-like [Lupinus angustifolius]
MEGFMATNSEKLDLTLKLSPCGQSEEGKNLSLSLKRSLSSMAVEKGKKRNVGNGAQEEGLIVACMERSASLPLEDDKGLLRRVKTGPRLMPERRRRVVAAAANGNPFHYGRGGGGNSEAQRSPDEDANSPVKKLKAENPHLRDDTMEILRKMPTVTTTGGGPNGRKIKGILYSYEKGEVFIVCVCHASFLSPAEFVKHAGGKEVENPMKLITVCPNSF